MEEAMEDEVKIESDGQEDETDLGHQDVENYERAVIWGTDWTAETIISQLRKKNIDLNPQFQRRDAWNSEKKSKFIESLILGIPVPPIILAERKDKKNSYIVIDGKQRLLSIMQFCSLDGDSEYKSLYLTNLDIIRVLDGFNYEKLKQDENMSEFLRNFENQTIRTIVIRNWPDEQFLYTVFLRLNTGSLKLSPQELRQALHPGDFLNYINDYVTKENPVREVLKLKGPDSRMRDIELILRYFAFKNFLGKYQGNLKDFLDMCCKKINDCWAGKSDFYKAQLTELENAIDFTTEIFAAHRFSKFINGEYTNMFNRSIFDIMVYYFSKCEVRNHLAQKQTEIKKEFEDLMSTDEEFKWATSSAAKDLEKTKKRYNLWKERLNRI